MKTRIKAGVCTLVLAAAAVAQQRPFGVLTAGSAADPATLVQRQVTHLTALLNLTTSQAAQATTIFTNAQTAITPLQTNLDTYRTNMAAAVKSNATATIDQIAAQIGTATGQITAVQNKSDAAFYAILTADQKTTLDASGGLGRGGPRPRGFGR
jgi:Spy/CpxP family protein refolding chaperone